MSGSAAISVMKAARDMGVAGIHSTGTSKKYVITGRVSEKEINRITENLLYNRIIQHVVVRAEDGVRLEPYRFRRVEVDLTGAGRNELRRISRQGQLYLSIEEMETIQEHFRKLGRNPTDCELETLAQTWSEHCNHKTMMGAVLYNGRNIGNLLKETVMKVTRERTYCKRPDKNFFTFLTC